MKKFLLMILMLVLITFLYLSYLFYSGINIDQLNFVQRWAANSVFASFDNYLNSIPKDQRAIVGYDVLMNQLNFIERNFAERIFSINPKTIGFKGPKYSKEKPGKLVKVESVKVEGRETGIQYCPEHSYNDYLLMMEKMKKDIGKQLHIDSGYRSPGKQAYLFFYYLTTSSEYSLKENAKWIAMPGYSEHGNPVNNAIDFTSENGINGFSDNQTAKDFEALPEFDWLMKNANQFNFYLSYPKDNPFGVAYEPWHWHWESK
ncbi:MAG: D-alanyl-D-alanine carboxypeptidase family protein [Ignavibacteriaceae bacterium]|nr:D-alanyl-D-alanine carboxypeptidase family protein [Ignavibacteriaceae bacterium]